MNEFIQKLKGPYGNYINLLTENAEENLKESVSDGYDTIIITNNVESWLNVAYKRLWKWIKEQLSKKPSTISTKDNTFAQDLKEAFGKLLIVNK